MTPLENIEEWRARATQAAIGFEARWVEESLWAVDGNLAARLLEQRQLFRGACDGGKPGEVVRHGAALCRGYAAAAQVMEDAHVVDTAYQIGHDRKSGLIVAVGQGQAPARRVKEIFPSAIYLTVDEVAILLGRVAALKPIVATKRQWPGCEILGEQPINQFERPIPADDHMEDLL